MLGARVHESWLHWALKSSSTCMRPYTPINDTYIAPFEALNFNPKFLTPKPLTPKPVNTKTLNA